MKWKNFKPWLKGGLIGLGIYIFGLILFGIDQGFSLSTYNLLDKTYILILFKFMRMIYSKDMLDADLLSFVIMPFIYFGIGALIGLIISKIKSKKKK
jgi:hypothetical protein